MASFGELVLVLGDLHIPHRASEIPEKLAKMLVPNKMQHILCTGNCCTKEQYESLRTLAPNVHCVRGDFDDIPAVTQDVKVVTIGKYKIGLTHGHQVVPWGDTESLAMFARQLDVDILVSGATHKVHVLRHEKRLFVNPGSITGAFSSLSSDVSPSFILMAVQDSKVIIYVYELDGDKVVVMKSEFSKEE